MMRTHSFILLCLGFILLASITPALAAPSDQGACGLGQYWLMQDNSWDGVWIRQGDSNTFKGFGALWQQPDGTATMTVSIDGTSVSASRIDDPNIFGTFTCSYTGTLKSDGVTIVGSNVCELDAGTSLALSWSATINCDTPVVTWSDTAFWHRAAKGQQFTFVCPPGGEPMPIWGTDTYIEGSSICTAGVHAGVITLQNGGKVTIEITPGEMSYPGSSRNGVTSDTFPTAGQFDASFRVVGGQTQHPSATATSDNTLPVIGSVLGVWQTDFGVITIATDGYGTYDDFGEPSHITFTHDDAQNVSGYWVEQTSQRECDTERDGSRHWGRLHLTFDPQFMSYIGVWGYCDDEPNTGWGGFRTDQPIIVPTSTPVAASWENFIGVWSTSYGDVTIGGDGVATYPGPDSAIPSHIYFQQEDDHTISGYWVQPGSSANCGVERYGSNYWGRIRWTFDENFATFTGLWAYCDAEPEGYWGGARAG